MKRNYKIRLIKHRHSYTFEEISEVLNVHPRTIQTWKKEGLKVIDSTKPYLVMGYDLQDFLNKKMQSRKTKLEANQFYCTKCRKAVSSESNKVWLKTTEKTVGKHGHKEAVITGRCETCGTKLNRFSHSGKLNEIKDIFDVINYGGLRNE